VATLAGAASGAQGTEALRLTSSSGQVVGDGAAAAHPKELAICPFLWPIRQRIGWGRGRG